MKFKLVVASAVLSMLASGQTLREAALANGIEAGAAASYAQLQDPSYAATLGTQYSQLEPENDMKWRIVHPALNTFAFGNGDGLVTFARAHSMKVRGHVLVGDNDLPSWLSGTQYSSADLWNILRTHIATVVGHYAGQVYAWDVANEEFDASGNLKHSIWYDQPGIGGGSSFIEQAFRWAHAADPNAQLFYNDSYAEVLNPQSDAIYAMAKDFIKRGVPLNGIGFQMHVGLASVSLASFEANMKRFTDLGLKVQITEMDVRLPLSASGSPSASDLTVQAKVFTDILNVCLRNPGCTALQTWGFSDQYSWVPSFFPGYGSALPIDQTYQPKPAYNSVMDVLTSRTPVLSASSVRSAASYTSGPIAPGEELIVFSRALPGVADSASDLKVTFNGHPAPIVSATSSYFITMAPFEIAGSSTATIQYSQAGKPSNTVSVPVAAAAPGIYSMSGSGSGQAFVQTADGSLNSQQAPAKAGTIISVYTTGGGQISPAMPSGVFITPVTANLTSRVTATIGGVAADVISSSEAPNLPSGIVCVKVRVPQGLKPGSTSIQIGIAGSPSQPGMTLYVN